jgi:Flp pilus assembly protein TadG
MKLKLIRDDTRGSTIVEVTVTLPLFLSLTFGLIQAGLLLWTQVGLQHGVEMAARCASVSDAAINAGLDVTKNPTPCYNTNGPAGSNVSTIRKFAAQQSFGLNPPTSSFTVNQSTCGTCSGNLVCVPGYTFNLINYIFSLTLKAKSCYPN